MFGYVKMTWTVVKYLNLFARVRECELEREKLKLALADRADRAAALETRIELMESFLEIGTIEVDRSGHLCMANCTFAEMTGYALEELIGLELHDLLPIFLQGRHRRFFKQAVEGHKKPPAIMLSELRRKDGTPQPVIVTTCEVQHETGSTFRADFRRR